jgi:hypothetical protein
MPVCYWAWDRSEDVPVNGCGAPADHASLCVYVCVCAGGVGRGAAVQEDTAVQFAANLMYAKVAPIDIAGRQFCFEVRSSLKSVSPEREREREAEASLTTVAHQE